MVDLYSDRVCIEGPSGRSQPYRASLSSKNGYAVYIPADDLDVDIGWTLVRFLPKGKEEFFEIIDSNYSEGVGMIDPYFTLTLKKRGLPPAHDKGMTVHISGSSGFQVGNYNVQHIANSFHGLIEKIDAAPVSSEDKQVAKGHLRTFLENPTVASVLGGAVPALLGLL